MLGPLAFDLLALQPQGGCLSPLQGHLPSDQEGTWLTGYLGPPRIPAKAPSQALPQTVHCYKMGPQQ